MTRLLRSVYNEECKFYLYYVGIKKDLQNLKNIIINIGEFKYHNTIHQIFYVNKDIILEKDYKVICFSYMISCDIFFINNNKININFLIDQFYNLQIQFPGSFSSSYFNQLHSDKIQYNKFLLEKKIIDNKYILTKENLEDNNFKNMVIKLPYSDTSKCVFYKGKNIRNKPVKIKDCYTDEGGIAELFNNSVGEFKIMTLFGKIVYLVYHNVTKKKVDKIILDKDFNCENKKIENMIKPYKDQIEKFIKKIYININLLIDIMIKKINKEITLYKKLKLQKLNLPLMNSLFYNKKIKYISRLSKKKYKTDKLLKLLNISFFEYYQQNKELFKKKEIHDPFIRIDIKLPDFINYDKIFLVELASYNSGKSKDLINDNNFDKYRNDYYLTNIMKKRYEYYKNLAKNNIINSDSKTSFIL